jgi:hypothetical protein
MPSDLFERIRHACRRVATRARAVRLDHGRLATFEPPVVLGDAPGGAVAAAGEEEVAALVVELDAVNFGSGWHPVLRKEAGLSGASTVAAALRRAGPLGVEELARLTPAGCAVLFGQDDHGPAAELMALFARSLNDLGRFVAGTYGGSFEAMVAAAGGSAAGLVDILLQMPLYRDVVRYEGDDVPLLKRAQITASDLASAFGGKGPGAFGDLDRLTMFADNLVPHVLRLDGVLVFEPELVARIDAGELLTYGSPEEVEIRACAVHAVELLAARLDRPARLLDHALWRRGGEPAYKAVPRHRCRTTAY